MHYPQWYSSELKSLIFNKKSLHKKFKLTNDLKKCIEFSRLRGLCKAESKKCHLRYLQKIQGELTYNPKSFWRYIKCLKSNNDIMPNTMVLNNTFSSGRYDVVN